MKNTQTRNHLSPLLNHLLVNALFEKDLGLYHGQMGIAISLYHYAAYTHNEICQKYADELIEQISNSIHFDLPINMEKGLCGIAWGISYLLRNDFLEGRAEEILKEIDEKIMERSLTYSRDLTQSTGIGGICTYINERKKLAEKIGSSIGLNFAYLQENEKMMLRHHLSYENMIVFFTKQRFEETTEVVNLRLGLMGGCAGLILKQVAL